MFWVCLRVLGFGFVEVLEVFEVLLFFVVFVF